MRARVRSRKPVKAGSKDTADRRRRQATRRAESARSESADQKLDSTSESRDRQDSALDPTTRLTNLSIDAPEVSAVELPHRALLEDRFGRCLDGVRVLTGSAVRAALDQLGAQAAEHDGRIFLRSADATPSVVAHEVAHTLQRRGAPHGLAQQPAGLAPSPESRVERDAQRAAIHGGLPTAVLPMGPVALLQQGQSPATEGQAETKTEPTGPETEPEQDPQSKDGEGNDPSAQDPADAGDAQPAIEAAKPTFAPAAMPDTQLSPEEQAKRQAELEEAKNKFDQAENAGGTVEAVKLMPPSAKAMHQDALGAKVGDVVAADQKKFEAEAPNIEARMGGEADVGEVPKVQAPAIGDVKLSDGQAAPSQKPDLPPTAEPQKYQGNKEVKTLMEKFFSLFGFGKDSINKSFKEVKTGDDIETSPGSKPKIPRAKGTETDDERIDQDKAKTKQESEKSGLDAQKKILEGPGPEQAKTREQTESRPLPELQKIETPAVVPAEGAQAFQQISAREDASLAAQFDKDQHESMQLSLEEAQRKTEEAEADRDSQRKAEFDKAETERKAVEEKADTDQRAKVLEARTTIQNERQKTVDAQAAEVKSVEKQSEKARKEERDKIKKRVDDDERAISTKYDEKEAEAKKEVAKGETKADKEKEDAEKESENESWWDKAKGWVKEQFAKLTEAIGKIFNAVRSLVKAALDAARKFAKDLIDAAAAFLKKAIEAFGELVKGLVNVLVGTFFPDLAKKLNEAIDSAVDLAKKGVDFVAEQMKKGVDAIVDALQKGLDAILNAFQAALNFAISLVQAALTGDWGAVFKQLLEAALKLLGIDPKEFYAFVAKIQETLGLIVDKPGQFLSNVLGAVKLGFSLFAGNFLKHLKAGIIGWLTGSLGGDITIPKTFDLLGILDLVRQLLGLTWDWLKKRAAKIIGEKNVERLEHLFSYVDTLRKEGWGGLFKRLQEDLVGLKEKVLGEIGEFLTVQVIKAAVLWLAGLFNPVGALVKVVMTIWNIYTFLRDQLSRIIQVVKTVVGALDKIARGVIEEAGKKVESVLGLLVPVAIDLLAKLLGLTGVTAKVRSILKAVNQSITKTVDKVLKKIAAKFKAGAKKVKKGAQKVGEKIKAALLWWKKEKKFKDKAGQSHRIYFKGKGKSAKLRVQSRDQAVTEALAAKEADGNPIKLKKQEALAVYQTINATLEQIYQKEAALDKAKKDQKDPIRTQISTLSTTLDTNIQSLGDKMQHLSIGDAVLAKSKFTPLPDGAKMDPLSNLPGNSKGQENTDQNLPAWSWLMRNWEADKYYENNWVRMHLIHHSLHGDGSKAQNLVVAPDKTNKAFLNKAESNAIQQIRDSPPQVLTYRTEIIPHGNIEGMPSAHHSKFPKQVSCYWKALTFDGSAWKDATNSIPKTIIDPNVEMPRDRSGDTARPIWELSLRDLAKVAGMSKGTKALERLHRAMQGVRAPGGLPSMKTAYEGLGAGKVDTSKEWTGTWAPALQAKVDAWNVAHPNDKPIALTASASAGSQERMIYDLSLRNLAALVGRTKGEAVVVRLHQAMQVVRASPSTSIEAAYKGLDAGGSVDLAAEWQTWNIELPQKVTAWNAANPNDKDVALKATPKPSTP